jgi:hypothetical protein
MCLLDTDEALAAYIQRYVKDIDKYNLGGK